MSSQKISVASLLNEAYAFQSVSGKNADFLSSIRNMPFFFRDHAVCFRTCSIPAGGKITYTVPVKFSQEPLPYAFLLYIESGEATLHIKKEHADEGTPAEDTCALSSGSILFLPEQMCCNFATVHTPFTYYIFYLSGYLLLDYQSILSGENGYFFTDRTSVDDIVWRLLPRIQEQLSSDSEISSLHLSAMLHLTFSALCDSACPKPAVSYPNHVLQVKEILDTDYQNPHSLIELEETTGVNRYRLCRDFSNCIGTSPVQYLNQVRLSAARHLLRSTNLTIHEVGSAVGIENTTHFINLFKKNTGITPLQFRQTSIH